MGLFSSIGNAIGGVVKSAVNLTTSMVKAPFQIANGVLNSVFGEDQGSQAGYGQQGPSIFGCGPRPMGPSPFGHHHHMHGPHGHHHHGPHMPPPQGGGIHFHFDS